MGENEVGLYLEHLVTQRNVSANTQNQALCALNSCIWTPFVFQANILSKQI